MWFSTTECVLKVHRGSQPLAFHGRAQRYHLWQSYRYQDEDMSNEVRVFVRWGWWGGGTPHAYLPVWTQEREGTIGISSILIWEKLDSTYTELNRLKARHHKSFEGANVEARRPSVTLRCNPHFVEESVGLRSVLETNSLKYESNITIFLNMICALDGNWQKPGQFFCMAGISPGTGLCLHGRCGWRPSPEPRYRVYLVVNKLLTADKTVLNKCVDAAKLSHV